jgi:hypothetical protein
LTPETGSDFWPPSTEILPDAQGMLWPYQYICSVAGPWVNVSSAKFNQSTYGQGGSGNLKVVFGNKGISSVSNVKIQCVPLNTYLNFPVQLYTRPTLAAFTNDSVTFNFTIAANAPVNCGIPVVITAKQYDTVVIYSKTFYCLIGNGTLTLADSAENGFTRWTSGGSPAWSVVTNNYHSPTHSFADNTSNSYGNNVSNYMVLTTPINTSTAPIVNLTYWQAYSTESGYDFCYLEASSDNGTTWQTVQQWSGTGTTWTQQSFDLSSYANASTQFKIRFRFTSDAGVTGQGWHVDDIKLYSYCAANLVGVGNNGQIPLKFALEQNFPNPFNPVTKISYQIPKAGFVTLKVFDILGREVQMLVNENQEAGTFSILFNGENLPSGVYYYKLESNNFVDTKKMLLIK